MKKLLVFLFVAAVSVAAAWYRHGDSAHAMGMVSVKGGRAHHPVHLAAGKERYTLVVTGTVIPPYRGDARIEVAGEPEIPFAVHGSDPIVDLALRHRPSFEDRTLTRLEPRDRFTVWVVMTPDEPMAPGRRSITLIDTASERPVLTIPVVFGEPGEEAHHDH
jgi:hypothetical protein